MSIKIKRDHSRIVDEMALIDERMMYLIISSTFWEEEIKEFKLKYDLEPSYIMLSVIINEKSEDENYQEFLNKVIERNRKNIYHILNTSLNYEEISKVIDEQKNVLETKRVNYYFLILLEFYSKNIFKGDTVYALRKRCKEVIDHSEKKQNESTKKKNKTIELREELKDTQMEKTFNSYFYEYDYFKEAISKFDPKKIAQKYMCKYDKQNKSFDKVRRGILYFVDEEIYRLQRIHHKVYKLMDELNTHRHELIDDRIDLAKRRVNYYIDIEKINKLKIANKALKKENKRLNAKVLKKIDKSSNKELENKVHSLQKDSNYFQSRIEKLEEQIAVLEEEKLLNKELAENIIIEEEKEKKAIELPEYQNIVIMGGRWTSNNRKDVVNYLPDNDIEFIDADKTLRHFDRIANADIIFFDTSYNSHSYYYRAKKCHNDFYHINNSNLNEIKKVFEGN